MSGNKKKAVFIDHSFKKRTRSNQFLRKIISQEFELEELWDETWKGGRGVKVEYLNKKNFNTIFFCQCLPSPDYIKRLNCRNLVWLPTYDSEKKRSSFFYFPYLQFNFKVFPFCKELHNKLKKIGFESYYYKYYPKPLGKKRGFKKKKVFFWLRTAPVNWSIVKRLLGDNKIDKLILKFFPDPYQKVSLPPKEDIDRFNIQIIKTWLSRAKYQKLLSSCNIFIAPRK